MIDLIKKLQSYKMSRRTFIGWTSAAAVTTAVPLSRGLVAKAAKDETKNEGEKEVWKTAACWHNCGGRCLNKVLVKDGVVLRQKTDDTHEDSPDYLQQRGCIRGRSQRMQVFGADRLKYPMKRKNWQPGGGKKELRGKDQWVRISWDEALDIVASEIKSIYKKYGNESIWAPCNIWTINDNQKLLAAAGGYVNSWTTASYGAWKTAGTILGVGTGGWPNFYTINDRLDLLNSQLFVIMGANPAWTAPGTPLPAFLEAKKAGAKFIVIDPKYTDTAQLLGADWIPIHPGTDHALILAIMNVLVNEDDPKTNPLIDWDVLNRCTLGFDKDHMPKNAKPEDNFKDYLLGTYDQQPKDPKWASEICGIDEDTIISLARKIGKTDRVALMAGWAPARINDGEGYVQAFNTLGYMTGHIGRPGKMTGITVNAASGNGGPSLVLGGSNGLPYVPNPVTTSINEAEIFKAIIDGKYIAEGIGEKSINLKMAYISGHAINSIIGTKEGIQALRKLDFVVSNAYVLNTAAKYSDIVLPVATPWELEGGQLVGNREILITYTRITKPLFEAKSDQWVGIELMKRMGIDYKQYYPFDEKQQFFNLLATSTVIKENGKEYEPLLTITQNDIDSWGVKGVPQKGRIPLEEYLEKGIYQVKRSKNDNYGYIALQDFIKDPESNPLESESGKFEIYCGKLHKASKKSYTEIDPIPKYKPKTEGYEATFSDWENKKKGKYPFQLFNAHYLRSSHYTLSNVPWLREAWPLALYMNKSDGDKLGIKNNDTVLITSRYGKALRPVELTETLMPGVVILPHGAWIELDDKEEIDAAGSDNSITGQITTGLGVAGYNTQVVNVEKWNGEPLEEDYKWEQRKVDFS